MSKQTGGSAFPAKRQWVTNGALHKDTTDGMSLRDYAVVAMMAAWRQSEVGTPFEDRIDSQCLAQLAVEEADAMLAEREKE